MRNLLLLCLISTLILLPLLVCSGDPALNDDVLGLIVFKVDIEDPDSNLASWNEDAVDPCNWNGVKCDPRSNRVSELSLNGFSLSGRIGRGLLRLDSLRVLSLSRNNFTGTLNPDLAGIRSLRVVDLSDNNLSGSIPGDFFEQCKSLRSVSLAKNALLGEIPPSVGSCSTLTALNLSSNRLSGRFPGEISSLKNLKTLDLSDNLLDGGLPEGIDGMRNLRMLSLRGNRLSGWLPDGVWSCYLLKSIDLSSNSFSGELPDAMRVLSRCSVLNLGSNFFSGEIPVWISEMKSLSVLDLSSNDFSGHVPDSLGELQLLEELDLSRNRFMGGLPESLAACESLSDVDFSRNSLTGKLPSWIFKLGLQRISISGNNLSGPIQIPEVIIQTLQVLDLSGNSLSGGIPLEIGNIGSLLVLNLSQNSLMGSIPSSLGELKLVEVLDLSQNRLNGSIPLEIKGASSLRELSLAKNILTEGIPTDIGNCSSLTSLILSQNNLTGTLPLTLGNLTNLQTLDLSFNGLTGALPKQLANLPHLLSFNISHNHFSGDIPAGSFFNTIPPSSLSGNPDLCGSAVNRSCHSVLPKPIVLNPDSSSSSDSTASDTRKSPADHHKKILLSISALVAIGAAALIAVGVVTITILNASVRSSPSHSAAALPLSDGYLSGSVTSDANSGKLVMFSGPKPEFDAGTHAILNKDTELGRGGFGAVYKTVLRDGRPMAIKKLTVSSLVKSQEDFEREVKKLGKARHRNLVSLEGFYWTPSLQLLIYEFVAGGNLYKLLHEGSALSWQDRFGIILGMARSLAHLHRMGIVHYNLKSSNVMIDDDGEAKVGDYGLARLLPMLDRYALSSKVQSAMGYMAPEFACRTVKVTEKCDVYGFGVLVMEVVTGRKPVEYMEDDVVVLCDVVRGALEGGRAEECVDGRLCGKFPVEEAVPLVKLGLICTSQVPSNRPEMGEVVKILEMIRSPQESQEEDFD